jgi:tRNA(Ile)-lysidine synthase
MVATRRLEALATSIISRVEFPDGPWLVALSGGADSAGLAWLAARDGRARAVHIHHGQPASDLLAEAATGVAATLGMDLEVKPIDLARWSEAAARSARYETIARLRRPDEWVLTGHTLDDQAETVLGHLLRGSGGDGLSGIARHNWPLARPLLGVTRSEIRELATLAGLPWMDDPANEDLDLRRNRLRHWLIPLLEAEFNPGLRRQLATAADVLGEERQAPAVVAEDLPDGLRLGAGMLWAVGRVAGIRSVRAAVRRLRGYGLDRAESDRVWHVVVGSVAATELSGRLLVTRSGPWLVISHHGLPESQADDGAG